MRTSIDIHTFITLIALVSISSTLLAEQSEIMGQNSQSFEKEVTKTLSANYLLYLPEKHEEAEKSWPLILFLHGAGERGSDLTQVEKHGPPKLIAKENKAFPFVIVSPQCPKDAWWSSELQIDTLNALLDDVISRYRIDEERIYVTGLSMGGHGTWRLATVYPNRFAAIAPICGGGNPEDAASIAHLPIWVFHGEEDRTVRINESEEMVNALRKAGSDVKFTAYPDTGHDSWSVTYDNPKLYEWFLEHKRSIRPGSSNTPIDHPDAGNEK